MNGGDFTVGEWARGLVDAWYATPSVIQTDGGELAPNPARATAAKAAGAAVRTVAGHLGVGVEAVGPCGRCRAFHHLYGGRALCPSCRAPPGPRRGWFADPGTRWLDSSNGDLLLVCHITSDQSPYLREGLAPMPAPQTMINVRMPRSLIAAAVEVSGRSQSETVRLALARLAGCPADGAVSLPRGRPRTHAERRGDSAAQPPDGAIENPGAAINRQAAAAPGPTQTNPTESGGNPEHAR